MCGIAGWIDRRQDLRGEGKTIKKMTQTMKHRGPDDLNIWVSEKAALGHARLVVVDPAGGCQPMSKTVRDREYILVYNGELYNTEEIRQDLLKKGYQFKGHSDTEVLLTSYMEWQEDCLSRFNGIFAFAIWDRKKEKLFAARDRLGVKPFFYSENGGRFLFGSEPKAILAHPDVKPSIDREGLSEVFGLGPSKTPGHGIYKGIHDLRPAHALSFTKDGLKIWRYWNVRSALHTDSLQDTVEHVRYLLKDAVERQLYADVPVTTFLSGGLDSSGISSIASNYFKRIHRPPLHTYSIDYRENDKFFHTSKFQPDSDAPYVKKVSDYLGTVHHSLVIDNEQLVAWLKKAIHMRDMPGYADVDSSLLWFCEGIKKDFTVALSGECADEIFGGYPWFHSPETSAKEGFPWMRSTEARQSLLNEKWESRLNLKEYALMRFHETVAETPRLESESAIDAKRRELFYLNMNWFMTALLDRKDRMSMGASLEVRVPFADHRLVQYLWNVPWEMKMHGGREKGILREALRGYLPDEVLYRKKSPYPKTFHPKYTEAVSGWLKKVIDRPGAPLLEFVQKDKVQSIIDTAGASFKVPWFGQLMSGPQLIAHLAMINEWLETYHVDIVDR
ncbi:asparagine synthase (glutamine-hydrolyzing) [Sporolactobacillus sp. THM19-2]|jgi:asparagine synthase (glutamine-hydrolysing)|uniref:asparagine synthase (glutamine-hydrolyzing) n=1 Tax=Sporolactobacillus sp. THM19-2 TaxID=2511171 RepID=UPI00101EA8E8|nr:asparagine synthase (glutamine-hydrolyzing) [Sporolactobacillus sp. THM19-2]RYL91491.1 asparagine synthase (glutamine-hydrolyzing) [Sporolactobacillus sp. THM19-2]